MRPSQRVRDRIHKMLGKEFVALDFKDIYGYTEYVNILISTREIVEVGSSAAGKRLYKATDRLRPADETEMQAFKINQRREERRRYYEAKT